MKKEAWEREYQFYKIDESLMLLSILISYFAIFFVFLFQGLFKGIPYWANAGDMFFIKNVLGLYSYDIHAAILLGVTFATFVSGYLVSEAIKEKLLAIKESDYYANNAFKYRSSYVLAIIFSLLTILILIPNEYLPTFRILLPWGILTYTFLGFVLGFFLGVHLVIRNIFHFENIYSLRSLNWKLAISLGLTSSILLFAMGIYVYSTGTIPPDVPNPSVDTTYSLNIVFGILVLIGTLLIFLKHIHSGSLIIIMSSYMSFGVGGGFELGALLGILSGVFGFMSVEKNKR